MSKQRALRFASLDEVEALPHAHMHAAQYGGRQEWPRLLENQVLPVVLEALRKHPRVAWAYRMNVGGARYPDHNGTPQWVQYGFPGMSDIFGQLKRTGQLIAVEVKRPGEHPTPNQQAFLDCVRSAGGIAFCARNVDDVFKHIAL
jgi:hypothetical protein